jgi:hypothetical protein
VRLGAILVTLAIIVGAYKTYGHTNGFSDEDIVAMKESIKAEFDKRPSTHVTDVTMARKTSSEAIGFVKFKVDGLDDELTKSCSANMVEGNQYLWKCE